MAVTLSNTYLGDAGSSSTDVSATSVVVATGERIIVGFQTAVVGSDAVDVTSVDWGADTAVGTLVTSSNISAATVGAMEIWEIAAPAVATRTLTVNYDTAEATYVTVWVVAGADAATDVATLVGSSTTAHEVTVSNTTDDDFILGMFCISASNNGFLAGEGITAHQDLTFLKSGSKDGADGTTGRFGASSNSARDSLVSAVRIPDAAGTSIPKIRQHPLKGPLGGPIS